jgi:dihydroneopterin aldolase
MALDKLSVTGMIFHAYHGLYEGERENGQRFEVDVVMFFNSQRAAASDRIKDTIDVRQVYEQVKEIVIHSRFYLIEAISQRIADSIIHTFNIEEIIVRVRKPFAPLGGLADGTEIEIKRTRSNH